MFHPATSPGMHHPSSTIHHLTSTVRHPPFNPPSTLHPPIHPPNPQLDFRSGIMRTLSQHLRYPIPPPPIPTQLIPSQSSPSQLIRCHATSQQRIPCNAENLHPLLRNPCRKRTASVRSDIACQSVVGTISNRCPLYRPLPSPNQALITSPCPSNRKTSHLIAQIRIGNKKPNSPPHSRSPLVHAPASRELFGVLRILARDLGSREFRQMTEG